LYKWNNSEAELRAYERALSNIENQITNINFYEQELYQYAHPLRRTIVESFRKFTLSLACLIFFFIGAPLGAIIRKGGLGTPVVISMLFFVVYYVVDISGIKLAKDGTILPFFGTFISTFLLLPIGIFLTWKSTRDSNLFNAESYLNFIKNLFKKHKKEQTC
jgi:Predicted permeases